MVGHVELFGKASNLNSGVSGSSFGQDSDISKGASTLLVLVLVLIGRLVWLLLVISCSPGFGA
jgi:hypothetical protein